MLVYRTTKLSTKQGETKKARAPKYAKALLEFMAQVQYLLPPSLAYELKWNRCVNHSGLPNSNYPNDLDVEHCNRYSKNEINTYRGEITEKTALRLADLRHFVRTLQIDLISKLEFTNPLESIANQIHLMEILSNW